jgi:hypothetical protein
MPPAAPHSCDRARLVLASTFAIPRIAIGRGHARAGSRRGIRQEVPSGVRLDRGGATASSHSTGARSYGALLRLHEQHGIDAPVVLGVVGDLKQPMQARGEQKVESSPCFRCPARQGSPTPAKHHKRRGYARRARPRVRVPDAHGTLHARRKQEQGGEERGEEEPAAVDGVHRTCAYFPQTTLPDGVTRPRSAQLTSMMVPLVMTPRDVYRGDWGFFFTPASEGEGA